MQKKRHHKKLWLVLTIIFALVVAGGGTAYYFYNQHQQKVAQAKAAKIAKRIKLLKKEHNYDDNFRITFAYLKTAYEDAKTVSDGYVQVWNDAIFSQIGAIVGPEFTVTKNFNEAIALKTEDLKSDGSIDEMKDDNKNLKENISSLGTPPKRFYDVASKLEEAYGKFQTYYSLAETPSGSFNSYKSQTDNLKSEIESLIDEINVSIPKVPNK